MAPQSGVPQGRRRGGRQLRVGVRECRVQRRRGGSLAVGVNVGMSCKRQPELRSIVLDIYVDVNKVVYKEIPDEDILSICKK